MKNMLKRFSGILLAVITAFGVALMAFAAESEPSYTVDEENRMLTVSNGEKFNNREENCMGIEENDFLTVTAISDYASESGSSEYSVKDGADFSDVFTAESEETAIKPVVGEISDDSGSFDFFEMLAEIYKKIVDLLARIIDLFKCR